MKASKLIRELKKLIREEGDLNVKHADCDGHLVDSNIKCINWDNELIFWIYY